tara:strand:- start:555 stop:884 length:330 start_codon:yes stop_codon:yes gene_type:complete
MFKHHEDEKKVVFYDSPKRHAEMKVKLHYDRLTQGEFFRSLITGYIEEDPLLIEFVQNYKEDKGKQSKTQIRKSRKEYKKMYEQKKIFNLGEEEIEDIFDILEQENPDL